MTHELHNRLKAARKKLHYTQAEAAKAWGVPLNTLICWENRRRRPATFSLVMLNSLLDEILNMSAGTMPLSNSELSSENNRLS
ncbi:MAG: XRE family transcriptional regulator [Verrucomicrobiaceae bacterium]|nr:MAG: XRE family transcriptional regulator [Verrucomicrobiaceae bacterium]